MFSHDSDTQEETLFGVATGQPKVEDAEQNPTQTHCYAQNKFEFFEDSAEPEPYWFLAWKSSEWAHLVQKVNTNSKLMWIAVAAVIGAAVAIILDII